MPEKNLTSSSLAILYYAILYAIFARIIDTKSTLLDNETSSYMSECLYPFITLHGRASVCSFLRTHLFRRSLLSKLRSVSQGILCSPPLHALRWVTCSYFLSFFLFSPITTFLVAHSILRVFHLLLFVAIEKNSVKSVMTCGHVLTKLRKDRSQLYKMINIHNTVKGFVPYLYIK